MEETKPGLDNMELPEMETENAGEAKKEIRRRKKLIIDKLRVQMEFYFSAANLSKDKFMNGLLEKDPYIDLDVFFTFNRIRSLTDDMNLLKRSIEKSPILELSEDGKKVKRSKPVQKKENEALCTIYVENIPSHVDHEWVYEIFVKYGTIDYISFPRFKSTGRPKGFAFVEFETPEMANVALRCFGAEGCTIPVDTEPSKLQSICTFEKAELVGKEQLHSVECPSVQKENRPEALEGKECSAQCKNDDSAENYVEEGYGKRKREEFCDDKKEKTGAADTESASKKLKNADSEADELFECSVKVASEEKAENKNLQVCETAKSTVLREVIEKEKPKEETIKSEESKPTLKTTEKSKYSELTGAETEIPEGSETLGKEIEKIEVSEGEQKTVDVEGIIREIRGNVDKEKDVGAKNPDQIKSILSSRKRSLDSSEEGGASRTKKLRVSFDTSEIPVPAKSVEDPSTRSKKKKRRKRNRKERGECLEGISLKVMSKQEWTRLRNQYLNMQKRNMEILKWDLQKRKYVPAEEVTPPVSEAPSKRQPKFVPNAIIKVSFEEPPQDPKKLQETIREGGRGGVAYVETSATEKDVYIRFISGESAAAYLTAGLWSRMVLLSGNEEKEYWNHCIESWTMRRNKKNKGMKGTNSGIPNKLRGREKLILKALREAHNDKPNSHKVFEN